MKAVTGIALLWGLLLVVRYGLDAIGAAGIPAAIVALGVLTLVVMVLRPVGRFLDEGAGVLLDYMPLFFIPVLVGVTAQQTVLAQHWFIILFTVIGASLIGLIGAATAFQIVARMVARRGAKAATDGNTGEAP